MAQHLPCFLSLLLQCHHPIIMGVVAKQTNKQKNKTKEEKASHL
jgi:hypothetical protein